MGKQLKAIIAGALVLSAVLCVTADGARADLPASNPAWTWQNPTPSGDLLDAVAYRSGAEAWAVGLSRGFYKTTDEGATWSVTRTGPSLGFYDLAFGDASRGAAVGETSSAWDFSGRTLVWRTSDGGTTWRPAAVTGTTAPLAEVDYGDATHAWAVGRWGTVIATVDGGTTWTTQSTPPEVSGIDLTGVSFVDHLRGWAVGTNVEDGESFIIKTTDGGTTWSLVDVIGASYLFTCDFVDANNGWAAGSTGTVWHTSDGGATWSPQALPQATWKTEVCDLDFVNGTQGWLVTNEGRIYATSTGGASWSVQKTVSGAVLSGLAMRDATHGIVTGDDGVVLHTSDGLTWTETSSGLRTPIVDATFVSTAKGWAVGFNGKVLRTSDGGETWTLKKAPTSKHLVAVDFVSTSRGWMCGRLGTVLRTTNGGATWSLQTTKTKRDLNGIDFVSSTRGWACGADGLILTTKDGGQTWQRQLTNTTVDLSDIQFLDARRGWACGFEKGLVLRTTDGGKSWHESRVRVMPWPGGALCDLVFVNRTHGWVCGLSPAGADTLGTIFSTTNGGRTWSTQVPSSRRLVAEQAITGIDFVNKTHGWAVGEHGLYLYTTDGGTTWRFPARPAPDETLLHIEAVTDKIGYMVGTGGSILKTTTGGH